jgi:hypothetical protein
LRAFDNLGKLVILLNRTVRDTKWFVLFLALWIFYFAITFIVLRVSFEEDDYEGFSMYAIIFAQSIRNFLGDLAAPDPSQWINENGEVDSKSWVAIFLIWLIWVKIIYIGLIIILNFLIALIS